MTAGYLLLKLTWCVAWAWNMALPYAFGLTAALVCLLLFRQTEPQQGNSTLPQPHAAAGAASDLGRPTRRL
jgi:hypothetical protein